MKDQAAARGDGRVPRPHPPLRGERRDRDPGRPAGEGRAAPCARVGGASVIAMEVGGKALGSEAFAAGVERWGSRGKGVVTFLDRGRGWAAADVRPRRTTGASPSSLTFPHRLARLVLIEQLYRAMTCCAASPTPTEAAAPAPAAAARRGGRCPTLRSMPRAARSSPRRRPPRRSLLGPVGARELHRSIEPARIGRLAGPVVPAEVRSKYSPSTGASWPSASVKPYSSRDPTS